MPTRSATSRSVRPARLSRRAVSQAASRISSRVASRRSASLLRLGRTTMIRACGPTPVVKNVRIDGPLIRILPAMTCFFAVLF